MRTHYEIEETAVTIICDDSLVDVAKDAIFEGREIVKRKILSDPFFRTTFEPLPSDPSDDILIRRMCYASVLSGVGPMAGVAGAIAEYTVRVLQENGAKHAIVENGGDIALLIDRDVRVGIFSDDPVLKNLAFLVPKRDGIFGICSSSATIGPSVSLGKSSISTVISDDVILADCCATKLGNLIKNGDDLSASVEYVGSIEGITGCMASCSGLVAVCGDLPELVKAEIDENRISRIEY